MDNYLSNIENRIREYFITVRRVEKLKKELTGVMKNCEDLNQIKRDYELVKRETNHIENKIYESKKEILTIQEKISEAFIGYKLLEAAINNLDGEDIRIMKLRYVDNLKYDRIAESLYTSKSTAFRKNKKIIMKIADNLN